MKRNCYAWIALCLIAVMACSALAEGALTELYGMGYDLLLNTDNVTITASAAFTYDGQPFKTFQGSYVQDGYNSKMDVALTTPLRNGGEYTGSYCVVANGEQVYEMRSDAPGEYFPLTKPAANTVLSNDGMTALLADLGGIAVQLADFGTNDAVMVMKGKSRTDYRISLTAEKTPELLNKALTMAAKKIIGEYFYSYSRPLPFVTVDDRSRLIATVYEEMYGEPLEEIGIVPELRQPEEYARYEAAVQATNAYLEEVAKTTEHSVVVIRGEDKSQTVYDSFNAFLLEKGHKILHYEDYTLAMNRYAQEHPDSQTPGAEMNAWYEKILSDNQCAGMLIESDGDYILCYNDDELSRLAPYTQSLTQEICTQMQDVKLQNADFDIIRNFAGHICAEGEVSFAITDFVGREHVLAVSFKIQTEKIGISEVKLFDPKDYGMDENDQDDETANG
ncbi:MAG: hypothetical protein IKW00_05520 [Clostridia bacterium]|nr:hypothetical protein [Clostridia bacterium]